MSMVWRKGCQVIVRTAVLLLWVLAVSLALEAGQAGYAAAVRLSEEMYKSQRVEELVAADEAVIAATAAQAPQPPAGVKRDLPPRNHFLSLDENQRSRFAAERRELTMLCEPDGTIAASYASPEPAEIAALAKRVRVGTSVASVFPPQEGQDALDAVRAEYGLNRAALHEYSLPLEGFPQEYACSFVACALKNPAGAVTHVMASVFDSKYEIFSRKYRPNIYRDNRSDPLFPQFVTAEFWTNSRGFRSEEVKVPKPAGVLRIACIGGSTTVEGPRNDLTYPSLLQKKLREHFKTDRIEVINCGVDSLDSLGAVERMTDYLALEPDLIIDYLFVNDATQVREMTAGSPSTHRLSLKAWLAGSRFLFARFPSWLLPSPDDLAPAIREFTQTHQRAILDEARKHGADMAVCSIAYPDCRNLPLREAWYFDNRYSRVSWGATDFPSHRRIMDTYNALARDFCRKEGLLYIPVQEELKGGMESFADVAHMRLPGIQRKADIIFAHIKSYVAARLAR